MNSRANEYRELVENFSIFPAGTGKLHSKQNLNSPEKATPLKNVGSVC